MRGLSLAVLVATCLTLGACSNTSSGSSARTTVSSTSTTVTKHSSGTKATTTSSISPEATQLAQELANLHTLLGETSNDLSQAQQDH